MPHKTTIKDDYNYKTPLGQLNKLSKTWNIPLNDQKFSKKLDLHTKWPTNRSKFIYPKLCSLPKVDKSLISDHNNDCIYFCGHSLGLQPVETKAKVNDFFNQWANIGIYGFFEMGDESWTNIENNNKDTMARLVGKIENDLILLFKNEL
jgi:hypothetical protein